MKKKEIMSKLLEGEFMNKIAGTNISQCTVINVIVYKPKLTVNVCVSKPWLRVHVCAYIPWLLSEYILI